MPLYASSQYVPEEIKAKYDEAEIVDIGDREARFIKLYNIYISEDGKVYRYNDKISDFIEMNVHTTSSGTKIVPLYNTQTRKTTSKTLLALMVEAFFLLKEGQTVKRIDRNKDFTLSNLGIFEKGYRTNGDIHGIPKKYIYEACSYDDLLLFNQDYDNRQPSASVIRMDSPYDLYGISTNGCIINLNTKQVKRPSFTIKEGYFVSLWDKSDKTSHVFSLYELMLTTFMMGCPPNYRIKFINRVYDPNINNIALVDASGETYTVKDYDDENVIWKDWNKLQISNLMHVKEVENYIPIIRHPHLYHRLMFEYKGKKHLLTSVYEEAFV